MSNRNCVLEVRNVCKKLKDFELNDINFSLERGSVMGFIGPNGAGKSTTIRCMMGLSHIDSGNINYFNIDFFHDMNSIKQRIGFVYDHNVFFEDLTVEKNKRIISMFYKQWDDKVFYNYIKEFGVPLSKPVKSLSKGTAMKFALAIALSHHAELIIMDEPTSGLDPIFRKELLNVLQEVAKDGQKTIFFSTHNISDLEHIANFITFIYNGEIQFCKKTEDILDEYVLVKGPETLKNFIAIQNPCLMKLTAVGIEAFIEKEKLVLLNSEPELSIHHPSLEEIMYHLVKSKE